MSSIKEVRYIGVKRASNLKIIWCGPNRSSATFINLSGDKNKDQVESLCLGVSIYNRTGRDIVVLSRLGDWIIVPTITNAITLDGVEIVIEREFPPTNYGLHPEIEDVSHEHDLKRAMGHSPDGVIKANCGHRHAYGISSLVPLEDIEMNPVGIYVQSADIVLLINEPTVATTHPFAVNGGLLDTSEMIAKYNSITKTTTVFSIVDNEGEYGDRYFNFLGAPTIIRAIKDPSRQSGIYMANDCPVNKENHSVSICEFISFIELEEIKAKKEKDLTSKELRKLEITSYFYKTREECVLHGSTEALKIRETLRAKEAKDKSEFEQARRRDQLQREREEHKAALEREQDLARAEREREKYERDKEREEKERKAREDKHKHDKSINWVKLISVIIGTVATTLTVMLGVAKAFA